MCYYNFSIVEIETSCNVNSRTSGNSHHFEECREMSSLCKNLSHTANTKDCLVLSQANLEVFGFAAVQICKRIKSTRYISTFRALLIAFFEKRLFN